MDGRRTTKRQYSTVRSRYRPTSAGIHPSQMGADETGEVSRILVWGTPRTTGRGGNMKIASIRTIVSQRTEQPADRTCRAGGRPAGDRIPEETIDTETASGISHGSVPCLRPTDQIVRRSVVTLRRATQTGLLDVEYSERLITEKRQDEGGTEKPCSSHIQLEMAVSQLQRDVEDCRAERELARNQTPAVTLRPQRRSGFTSTPVPRYSGKSNWEQYREVFEAIVCSNGWDDVTAALQLLSHLDGDALNVALLVPESRRVKPGFLIVVQIITTLRGVWQNTSVSFSGHFGVREMIRQFSLQNCKR